MAEGAEDQKGRAHTEAGGTDTGAVHAVSARAPGRRRVWFCRRRGGRMLSRSPKSLYRTVARRGKMPGHRLPLCIRHKRYPAAAHRQNGSLRWVNDRRKAVYAIHAQIADAKCATADLVLLQLIGFGPRTQIGQLVCQRRKEAGMTLKDAAALAGVGVRFLSELERGKPTLQLGLAISVLQLFGLELHVAQRGDQRG